MCSHLASSSLFTLRALELIRIELINVEMIFWLYQIKMTHYLSKQNEEKGKRRSESGRHREVNSFVNATVLCSTHRLIHIVLLSNTSNIFACRVGRDALRALHYTEIPRPQSLFLNEENCERARTAAITNTFYNLFLINK